MVESIIQRLKEIISRRGMELERSEREFFDVLIKLLENENFSKAIIFLNLNLLQANISARRHEVSKPSKRLIEKLIKAVKKLKEEKFEPTPSGLVSDEELFCSAINYCWDNNLDNTRNEIKKMLSQLPGKVEFGWLEKNKSSELKFEALEAGGWLCYRTTSSQHLLIAPFDRGYFEGSLLIMVLVRYMFSGFVSNPQIIRFVELYRPCKLVERRSGSGWYEIDQRGYIRLQGDPPPELTPPREYSQIKNEKRIGAIEKREKEKIKQENVIIINYPKPNQPFKISEFININAEINNVRMPVSYKLFEHVPETNRLKELHAGIRKTETGSINESVPATRLGIGSHKIGIILLDVVLPNGKTVKYLLSEIITIIIS